MVFVLVFVRADREPLGFGSFLAYKFYVYRECDGLKFSFTELFLPCLDYKCLKLLYLYVKITLYYVKKSNSMYEYNSVSNQGKATSKTLKQSNTTYWSSHQLDIEYLQIRDQITKSEYYKSLQKQAKIRLNGWISKLDGIITNSLWKKNRNNYAKLLNLMCECEVIISPFAALPPHSDICTLTKYQINAIIDQVQLAVKNNTLRAQNWLKEQLKQNNQARETPKQHWSRVRQMKQKYGNNIFDQSSIKQSSSIDYSSKYTQKRVKANQSINESQQSIKSMPLRVINLLQKQNIRPGSTAFKKSINISESCQKQLFKDENVSKTSQNIPIQLKTRPAQNNCTNLVTKNNRIATNYTGISQGSQPSMNFRDQYQSIQIVDDTIQSQICYNQDYESYTNKDTTQINELNLTECNFSDQFSQRCKNKQEVLIKNYFSWKKINQITYDNKSLNQIEIKQTQAMEPSNLVAVDAIQLKGKNSNFTDESKIVQLSESYQKQYWECDSISGDFNYHQEGENIQINQCEQQQIGEEGSLNLSNKHLKEGKPS